MKNAIFVTALSLLVGWNVQAEDKAKPVDVDKDWATIKGRIVFDGSPLPKRTPITPTQDKDTCLKDKDFLTEDWVVNEKNKGVRDVYVWLHPDGVDRTDPFPQDKIHPKMKALAVDKIKIEQPCCRFIPRATAARAGQTLIIDGSPEIAHNAKWESEKNGTYNPIIPKGGSFTIPNKLMAEPGVITLNCSIHPWMKATVRVFDHPYYAVTDDDGKFEIRNAPLGKFRMYVIHPTNGWLNGRAGRTGTLLELQAGVKDLGEIKMKENK